MRKAWILAACLSLGACSGDDATGPAGLDVRGTYVGAWMITLSIPQLGENVTFSCPGSVTISSQSGASVSGTFVIRETAECDATSGTMNGTVRSDGGINFTIDAPGVEQDPFEVVLGCRFIGGSSQFNGTIAGGQLNANASATYDCPVSGSLLRVNFTVRLDATKA